MQNTSTTTQIGLVAAIFLIMTNMLGSGVFMLPATLAAIGGISLIGWVVAMVGVIALALTLVALSRLLPNGVGPYDYARKAFGDYVGYQTNYVYSIAAWIGNVSLISVMLGYLANLVPFFSDPVHSTITQIVIIWFFTWLNIRGAKVVSLIQSVSLTLAIIPILFVATVGWYWFDYNTFMAGWNVSGVSGFHAVNASFNNIMWAFIGIESACIATGLIKNPGRNIPLATIGGVIIATLLYISTCAVIMGIIPNAQLAKSSAPFAAALSYIGGSEKLVILISMCAMINCLGALAGWTMVIGQTAKAAAEDGSFPKFFAKVNKKGVPGLGLISLAIAMTVVVLITMSPTANQQFSKIITMSVILYLIPYIYSGFSVIVLGHKNLPGTKYIVTVILGIMAAGFCMWSILGSDKPITVWAFLVIISSTLFYSFKRDKTLAVDLPPHHIHTTENK